jgi:glycyl-tRNA synthetase
MAENKSSDELKDELDALDAEVRKHGAHIRQLKKDGADVSEIGEATKTLQALKNRATTLREQIDTNVPTFNRKSFDDLIIRKMFIVPSFEIHGGVKGLFDLGPPACALKVRMTSVLTRSMAG